MGLAHVGLGRVAHEYGAAHGSRMREDGRRLCGAKIDEALEPGALDHALGIGAVLAVGVGGNNAHVAFGCGGLALVGLGAHALPGVRIVQECGLKAPVLAGLAGGAVEHLVHGLDQKTAARARKVDERRSRIQLVVVGRELARAKLAPAHLRQHERGVVGAEHVGRGALGRARGGARQALEQRVAREIDVQARAALAEREQQAHVGVGRVGVGALAGLVGQAIAHGVLNAQGREVRVAERVGGAGGAHGKACARREDVLPSDVVGGLVERVGVGGVKARDHGEHAARQARPHAGAVGGFDGALKGHAALEPAHVLKPERAHLVGKGVFEPLGAACVEFHVRPHA